MESIINNYFPLLFYHFFIIIANMDIVEYIKSCLYAKNMTFTKLAELTGQAQPNLANKVKRGSFKTDELERYADAMNADMEIRFIDRNTHLPIGESAESASPANLESTVSQINDKLGEICGLLRQNVK